MSLTALLVAVRDTLREKIPLAVEECGIQPDGQPPPSAGRRYVAIHPTLWSPEITQGNSNVLDETFSLACTLTFRIPARPRDQQMEAFFLEALDGMDTLARNIVSLLHASYDILDSANLRLNTQNFIEPLWFAGADASPRGVDATWFWSDNPNPRDQQLCGYALEIRFQGARRVQSRVTATLE